MANPIKLDRSSCTIVVWCADHPEWAVLEWHTAAAYEAACAHEIAGHPGSFRMLNAAAMWARRADESAM